MAERYTESTRVRPMVLALASFFPGVGNVVSAADNAVMAYVAREHQARLNALIEALEEGLDDFAGPIDIYRAEPVLHAAYVTIEATLRTSRREKIRAFAKLLIAGLEQPPRLDLTDEHEDYLKILDELSMRELGLLATLAEFGGPTPKEDGETDIQWTNHFWEQFEVEACHRLGIPKEEFSGLMSRLTRTGTYEPFIGAYLGYTGGRGKLTGTYYRLASLISDTSATFDTGRIV